MVAISNLKVKVIEHDYLVVDRPRMNQQRLEL